MSEAFSRKERNAIQRGGRRWGHFHRRAGLRRRYWWVDRGQGALDAGGPLQGGGRRDRDRVREGGDLVPGPASVFPRHDGGNEHDPDQHRITRRPANHKRARANLAPGPRLDPWTALRLDGPPET